MGQLASLGRRDQGRRYAIRHEQREFLKADDSVLSRQMDALQNWFFWTWKIGVSTEMGYATSPFWHYRAGLENGWMPTDPRGAYGTCNTLGMPGSAFNGTYPATATGAVRASHELSLMCRIHQPPSPLTKWLPTTSSLPLRWDHLLELLRHPCSQRRRSLCSRH